MTEAELRALVKARLKSKTPREWILLEASGGSKADRVEWQRAVVAEDAEEMARLKAEGSERMARAEEILNGF